MGRPPSVPFLFVPQEFHSQAGLARWPDVTSPLMYFMLQDQLTVQSNLPLISAIITFFDIELLVGSELSIHNSQLALIKAFFMEILNNAMQEASHMSSLMELSWSGPRTKSFPYFQTCPQIKSQLP